MAQEGADRVRDEAAGNAGSAEHRALFGAGVDGSGERLRLVVLEPPVAA